MKTADDLASVRNLIERVRVAMLTTVDPSGVLHCRPLLTLEPDDDGRLWFLLSASARDVDRMNRQHRRVGIAYADPNKQDYASLSGSGTVVHDRERMRDHWNAWVELWFPLGIDDPDLALLRVAVEHAAYWEAPGAAARRIHGDEGVLKFDAAAALGEPGRLG